MQIFSHRGFHLTVPENTIAAFEAALNLGVDGIETDIRLDVTGLPILYHDRLAPNGEAVASITQTALSQIVEYPVPSLKEALEWSSQHPQNFQWNLEVKVPEAFPVLKNHLQSRKLQGDNRSKILLTSFWHNQILKFPKLSNLDLGLLMSHYPDLSAQNWINISSRPISSLVFYMERLDIKLVRCIQSLDLMVFAYGDQTPTDLHQLKTWEVDGIITNRPDWLDADKS